MQFRIPDKSKLRYFFERLFIRRYGENLRRRRLLNFNYSISMPHRVQNGGLIFVRYEYWCECGTPLTDGPSGGLSINAVCKKCRINYGCLDGYIYENDKQQPIATLQLNHHATIITR